MKPRALPAPSRLLIGRPRIFVRLDDIIKIEGNSNYSIARFANGTALLIGFSLHTIATRIPELVRIHNRYLVNPYFVASVRTRKKSEILLTTGEVLPVARRRKYQVRDEIKSFQKYGFRLQ